MATPGAAFPGVRQHELLHAGVAGRREPVDPSLDSMRGERTGRVFVFDDGKMSTPPSSSTTFLEDATRDGLLLQENAPAAAVRQEREQEWLSLNLSPRMSRGGSTSSSSSGAIEDVDNYDRGRNFVASVAALGLESLGKDPADDSSQHVDAEQLQGLQLQPNNLPAQTPRPSLVDDDKERFLTNRALYRRELFSNMPMFFAKCLTWPIVPSMVGGSIQLALDRALPMPGHRPFPAWLAFGRVYMFFALQCPFQALHRRHSAWHWFAAGGMVGAFDYRMNNASFVHQFLRLTEYEEIQKTAKKGDWRYLLRYVHGVHLSFFAYGCGAALLGRFAGVPW